MPSGPSARSGRCPCRGFAWGVLVHVRVRCKGAPSSSIEPPHPGLANALRRLVPHPSPPSTTACFHEAWGSVGLQGPYQGQDSANGPSSTNGTQSPALFARIGLGLSRERVVVLDRGGGDEDEGSRVGWASREGSILEGGHHGRKPSSRGPLRTHASQAGRHHRSWTCAVVQNVLQRTVLKPCESET